MNFSVQKINILPLYATAIEHRAIDLVERLIQTIKRQLSCTKTHLNKKFNYEKIFVCNHTTIQNFKTKTIDNTPFEAHFGRKCNTLISSITTKSNKKNLNYNKIIRHYFVEDKIPGRSYLTEEQWAEICVVNSRSQEEEEK